MNARNKLTRRQQEVYDLLVEGKTVEQISVVMGVTVQCVACHMCGARKKILDARLPWPSIMRRNARIIQK